MTGGDVTVVVPVWNRRELLEPLLCGLRAQTEAPAEVLVVDDGSGDGSAETAESLGARVIRMGAHGGFARAVNRGIRESRTPLIAVVNNDVELSADWIERLLAAFEAKVWFATGRILQATDRTRVDATYDALCRGGTAWRVGHGLPDGPPFRTARKIQDRTFYRGAISRRTVRQSWTARRTFRVVSGRCGFRVALCSGRLCGAVRAGCRRLALGKRDAGTLASGNHAPHRAQPGLPRRQALSRAPADQVWVAHRRRTGLVGSGGAAPWTRMAVAAR